MITEALRIQFEILARIWEHDTRHLSNSRRVIEHPSAKQIAELADNTEVLSLIFEDMFESDQRVLQWFVLLPQITKVLPIPEEDYGYVEKMRQHWLTWGRENNFLKTISN